MANPLISIVMPAYNSEKYIRESLDSVRRQTYKNWELIVVDDGSNDKTGEIVKEAQKGDCRIKLYKNDKNIGVSMTRNRAVSLSSGGWIAFLDSDDCWKNDKLEKQMSCVKKNSAEFIYTGSSFMDADGGRYGWKMKVPASVSYVKLLRHNVISCSSVLIKKNILIRHKMIRDNIHEDYALWLNILKYDVACAYAVQEPLLIYRICRKSKSGNKFKSIIMTYRTYIEAGLNNIQASYYICFNIVNNLKKYSHLIRK